MSDKHQRRTEQRMSEFGEELVRRRAIEEKSSDPENQINLGDSTFLKIAYYGGSLLIVAGGAGLFLTTGLVGVSVLAFGPGRAFGSLKFGMVGLPLVSILVGVLLQVYSAQMAGVIYD